MEFYEHEAGLSPVEAGYIPSPVQAAYLAAAPVEAMPQGGDEVGLWEKWGAQFMGTAPIINPATGLPLDIAMAGIHPAAFLGPAITAGLAGLAGAMLPVGPGAAQQPYAGMIAPSAPGTAVVPGNGGAISVNGVPVGGPGVPEPPKHMIAKTWNVKVDSNTYGTFRMWYFRLIDGRCMSYHSPTKTWKIWRPKKHIVISSNPRVKMLSKLNRLNKRVEKMLRPYQPKKPKTKIVPARALSAIERAELRV